MNEWTNKIGHCVLDGVLKHIILQVYLKKKAKAFDAFKDNAIHHDGFEASLGD